MTIQGVIFDLDNTLLNRKLAFERYAGYFIDRFVALQDPKEAEGYVQYIVQEDRNGYRPKRELYTLLRGQLPMKDPATSTEQLLETWFAEFPRFMVHMEGALPMLARLKESGLKLGLITNGTNRSQFAKIRLAGFEPLMDTIVVSDDVEVKKPMKEIFMIALHNLGLTPQHAVFIGDHPVNDIRGAQEAGLHAIWLRGFMAWPEDYGHPLHVIDHLEDVESVLLNLAAQ